MAVPPQSSLRWRPKPVAALGVVVLTWIVIFGRLAALRQDRFGTFGFDLGIYDQATWLVANFKTPFMTTRGIDVFGHHATFILYLFAPGYWLGWGPRFLTFAGVVGQASGAIAVYLIARDLIRSHAARWLGVALAGVYLLHPTSGWLVWEQFHPDSFSIAPLLFAYWALRTNRWKVMWPALVVAIFCKEDMATAVAILGILLCFRKEWRRGITVVVGAAAWYLAVNKLLIPWRNGGDAAFYTKEFFGELGTSPFEVIKNLVVHPGRSHTATKLFGPARRTYYWSMFSPSLVVVPFLRFDALLIGIPMLIINVISAQSFTYDYRYHYAALPLVAITAATVEAVAAMVRWSRTRDVAVYAMVGALVIATLWAYRVDGVGPGTRAFRRGAWPIHADENVFDLVRGIDSSSDERARALNAALQSVPETAATSASYSLVPHVSDRRVAFEFPNPWLPSNWGIEDRHQRDPAEVKYLFVDRAIYSGTSDFDVAQRELLGYLLLNEFVIVSEKIVGPPGAPSVDAIVAKRVRGPGCIENVSPQLVDHLGTHLRLTGDQMNACPAS